MFCEVACAICSAFVCRYCRCSTPTPSRVSALRQGGVHEDPRVACAAELSILICNCLPRPRAEHELPELILHQLPSPPVSGLGLRAPPDVRRHWFARGCPGPGAGQVYVFDTGPCRGAWVAMHAQRARHYCRVRRRPAHAHDAVDVRTHCNRVECGWCHLKHALLSPGHVAARPARARTRLSRHWTRFQRGTAFRERFTGARTFRRFVSSMRRNF